MSTFEIYARVTPKQQKFIESTADEVLFGGQAGGGKSYAQIMDAKIKAMEYPGIKQIIFRRTFTELEKSIIREMHKVYERELWSYNDSKHTATCINTSLIDFAYIGTEGDLDRYQSAEYDIIRFDELTHFTEEMYTYMMSRCRGVNDFPKQMKSTTNPGKIGHAFVKARFIDPVPPNTVNTIIDEDGDKTTRLFIPSAFADNFFLVAYDKKYWKRLDNIKSDNERRALKFGDWDLSEGQFFTEWNYKRHVVPPYPIPKEWRRFRCMDHGYTDPTAIYWIAIKPNGRIVVYREYYETKKRATTIAKEVVKLSMMLDEQGNKIPEVIAYNVGSPDIWNEHGHGDREGVTIGELLQRNGLFMEKADTDRKSGWNVVREYLADMDDGLPGIEVFDTCVNLIRTLPSLVYDNKFVEDIADHQEDHAAESLRYGLMSRPHPAKVEPEKKIPQYDPLSSNRRRKGGFVSK